MRADAFGVDLNALLQRAVELGASDIHFKPGRPPVLRRDGALGDMEQAETLTTWDMEDILTTVSRPEGDRVHTHSIAGYVRCADACPKSGTLLWTNARGLTLKLEFLPDGEAQLTTRRGKQLEIPLFCAPDA